MILLGFIYWMIAGFSEKFLMERDTLDSNHLALFVRQIGLLALALPLLWAVCSIKKERDPTSSWGTPHTIVMGILIAFAMFYLLGKSMSYGRERSRNFFIKGGSIEIPIKPKSDNLRHVA